MTFPLQTEEDTDYINVLNHLEEMDRDYFSHHQSGHLVGDSFQNLSKSDYAKVIFCDLYYNSDSTVGCRFQITDNVHEDPCDYIGLFRVGYDNLSQCLASKMLSHTECEEDGKLLRCTFKPSELPDLENGFYQFLYVTRDHEVCGASMPFHVKNSIPKDLSSDEDVVAENSEDDFLVVRSNMAEKNRHLQELVDEMNQKLLTHENEMRQIQEKLKIVNEEKSKIELKLRQAAIENVNLMSETHVAKEEKKKICKEKEEAVRILQEKNKVYATMFDDYSDKLKEFTEHRNSFLTEKKRIMAVNSKLQEQIKKMADEINDKDKVLKMEKEKKQELAVNWRKESSILASKLDDARLMIEALEKNKELSLNELTSLNEEINKLQEQLKIVKCENLTLKTRLINSAVVHAKSKEKMDDMTNEIAALKLHIIEMHESNSSNGSSVHAASSEISEGASYCVPEVLAVPQTLKTAHEKTALKILADLLPEKMELQQAGSSSDEIKEDLSDLKMQQTNEVLNGLKLQEEADVCMKTEQENEKVSIHKLQQKNVILSDLIEQASEICHRSKMLPGNQLPIVHKLKQQNEKLFDTLKVMSKKLEGSQDQKVTEELKEFKKKCAELECLLEQKDTIILKLKEELIKSNGVVEYLTKEKESVQKNGTALQDALNESILRLSEGSELYKKQFRKIEKLKKKLRRSQTDFRENKFAASVKDQSSSVAESADEDASTGSVKLPQNQNSDSDTGEHVIRTCEHVVHHPVNNQTQTTALLQGMQMFEVPQAVGATAAVNEASCSTLREVPGLQTLIEMNLEKFKNSQPKEDDILYAVPCPVCDQDIGVNMDSAEELVKHLEMQHKQQVCPVCSKLFDMSLPPKYFAFHVEDHFMKEGEN